MGFNISPFQGYNKLFLFEAKALEGRNVEAHSVATCCKLWEKSKNIQKPQRGERFPWLKRR
jgi:hypothetical protein